METLAATFTPNPIMEALKDRLLDLGLQGEYGTLFTYRFLEDESKLPRAEVYRVMDTVNNKLLLNQKMFKNVRGKGYKIALPQEQMINADSRRMRAGRQIYKGLKEVRAVNTSKLSPEEKVRCTHLVNKMASNLAVIRQPAMRAVRETTTVLQRIDALGAELQELKDGLND